MITRRRLVQGIVALTAGAALSRHGARGASRVRLHELDLGVGASGLAPQVLPSISIPYAVSHLGARWVGEEEVMVEVRWRATGAPWDDWRGLHVAPDLGNETRGVWLSGLVVARDAVEVQVRLLRGTARHLTLIAIDAYTEADQREPARFRTSSGSPDPGARVPGLAIVSRREWGADESLRKGHPSFAPITRASVHHTVTPNDDLDPGATVRAILAYHTQANGWDDIGYNFLIDAEGRIYEGRWARAYDPGETPTAEDARGHGVIGAHTGKDNPGTLGVALLGTFTSAEPSPAAVDSLQGLLAWEADRHGIDPFATTAWSTGENSTVIGHRDAGRTACPGDQLYAALPSVRQDVADRVAAAHSRVSATGYWLLARDGRVFAFGEAEARLGAAAAPLVAPAVSIAATPSGQGYWILSGEGRVLPFGDARFWGSTEGMALNASVVRLEATPSGLGYWIISGDGGVFAFGDARFFGSAAGMAMRGAAVALSPSPSSEGYWLAAADGGVFAFGDARFFGSAVGSESRAPVVAMAARPAGDGYWLLTEDGGVVPFGRARLYGDIPGLGIQGAPPSVQIRATPSGYGYYLLGADGGVFTFGDARFFGASPGLSEPSPSVDLALQRAQESEVAPRDPAP